MTSSEPRSNRKPAQHSPGASASAGGIDGTATHRPKKILVVFYSRGGRTRSVARQLAEMLGADVEELVAAGKRTGRLGLLRCVVEALAEIRPRISAIRREPSAYDIVVVGSPVWAARVSSPVRTYLCRYASVMPRVALFCTMGSSGAEQCLGEMGALLDPHAEVIERDRFPAVALDDGDFWSETRGRRKLRKFADAVASIPVA